MKKVGEPDTHVVPINDAIEHSPIRQCWCRPDVNELIGVVTHHSLDCREYINGDAVDQRVDA